MKNKTAIIIEDDPVYSTKIEMILISTGIDILKYFDNATEAIAFIKTQTPDLIISDIFLKDEKTGIDLVKEFRNDKIPIILMTNSTNEALYEEVKNIKNINYIIKPFHKLTLISIIEQIFTLEAAQKSAEQLDEKLIYIKYGPKNKLTKIEYREIVWIEASNNYCIIQTKASKFTIKKSLVRLLSELDNRFTRSHSKYAVNRQHIKAVLPNRIYIQENYIPIGRAYHKSFMAHLQTHKG